MPETLATAAEGLAKSASSSGGLIATFLAIILWLCLTPATFGRITPNQQNNARLVQLGARVTF